jgi:hypothetical protein
VREQSAPVAAPKAERLQGNARQGNRPSPADEAHTMRSTKRVIDNHVHCFCERDLEGILSDYAPQAILFTPAALLKSTDAIRPVFETMIEEFGKPGSKFSLDHLSVEGDYGYILWTAETADNVYELVTDTFVVRDGKIAVQSFAGKVTPKN